MNILFVGVGFFPWPTSGEKNFFLNLFPLLKQEMGVYAFSLNDYNKRMLVLETSAGNIPVYCARRPFHSNYDRFFFQNEGYTAYHHRHKPQREIVEKFVSVVMHLPRLRRIISKHQIDIIHFMDNFSLAMPFLGVVFPKVKITYSAANYDPRGSRLLYDTHLKMSIGHLSAVGVYTQAYLQKLRELGVNVLMELTPWGVPVAGKPLSSEKKSAIRQQLNIMEGQRLFLWSGYLQQIQEADYYKAVKVAQKVVKARSDVTFLFAFKPETFRPVFAQEAGERIKVITGVKNFGDVLETADLFYSPIGNSISTVSPPLTWLEAMSKGTPVITTAVGGVEEVIDHRKTGYIASGYDDLADVIMEILENNSLSVISQSVREFAKQKYDIQHSAEAYLKLWRDTIKQ